MSSWDTVHQIIYAFNIPSEPEKYECYFWYRVLVLTTPTFKSVKVYLNVSWNVGWLFLQCFNHEHFSLMRHQPSWAHLKHQPHDDFLGTFDGSMLETRVGFCPLLCIVTDECIIVWRVCDMWQLWLPTITLMATKARHIHHLARCM